MFDVYAKWARWSDWQWAWYFEDYDQALAYKKILRNRGYYGVSIEES